MTVCVTGASGFIGTRLLEMLRERGHTAHAVSVRGDVHLPPCDAVIHLAGEPIAQRWSSEAKTRIERSRIEGTRKVVAAMKDAGAKVLVCASAIGIYGDRGDEWLTEDSPLPHGFVADVARNWESEAAKFSGRVVSLRIGIVLGKGGGALGKMLLPFKLGVGGRLGHGKQWMSWIHIEDLCRMIVFALENESISGPINAVAPNPATNAQFTRTLAASLHRPAIFPVPEFALRLVLGEMSQILLDSARVSASKIQGLGFTYRFPELAQALQA